MKPDIIGVISKTLPTAPLTATAGVQVGTGALLMGFDEVGVLEAGGR